MQNRAIIIVIALVVVVALVVGYFFLREAPSEPPSQPQPLTPTEPPKEEAGLGAKLSDNPTENVPELNPLEETNPFGGGETNPFKDIQTNPFE